MTDCIAPEDDVFGTPRRDRTVDSSSPDSGSAARTVTGSFACTDTGSVARTISGSVARTVTGSAARTVTGCVARTVIGGASCGSMFDASVVFNGSRILSLLSAMDR